MHRTFRPFPFFRALAPLALAALAACSQAPVHHTPELPAPLPAEWKTLPDLPAPPGWVPADQAATQAAALVFSSNFIPKPVVNCSPFLFFTP